MEVETPFEDKSFLLVSSAHGVILTKDNLTKIIGLRISGVSFVVVVRQLSTYFLSPTCQDHLVSCSYSYRVNPHLDPLLICLGIAKLALEIRKKFDLCGDTALIWACDAHIMILFLKKKQFNSFTKATLRGTCWLCFLTRLQYENMRDSVHLPKKYLRSSLWIF